MKSAIASLAELGIVLPEVLLPAAGMDPQRWAVVACDQYSSERSYWERAAAYVGEAPSTLNLIYPECYLEDDDKAARVARIQACMTDYLARGLLEAKGAGLILVERFTPYEKLCRKGLMLAVDLERYRYGRDSTSLIRPTEGTIVERLPPRMEIRRGAALELPHIMLLVDDPARTVIEPLYARKERFPKLYDFDLMLGSGHIRGWQIKDEATISTLAAALGELADPAAFKARHGDGHPLLFAVGDGNHSLATAKAVWEELKTTMKAGDPLLESHPARFALVELVNIYDEGLPFHPIHRVLFGADERMFHSALETWCRKEGLEHRGQHARDAEAAFALVDAAEPVSHKIGIVTERTSACLTFPQPRHKLAAGTIQAFLDYFLASHPGVGIDYIHGTESLVALARKSGNLGLYLPPIDKGSFFATVIRDGTMPRKTFSMGEAPEKRFYLEARRISP